jgi:hypothetical protein
MTNKRKDVVLRYSFGNTTEVHEVLIGENDTPPQVTLKVGKQGNFYVVDPNGVPFGKDDSLFGYATTQEALPVQILHGSALRTLKTRALTPKKDNRIKVECRFGDEKQCFERSAYQSYKDLVEDNCRAHSLPDSWQIASVREEDDRIIVVCEDGANPFWFIEKMCPALKIMQDKIYANATRVPPGSWSAPAGVQPQIAMFARARAAAGPKPCHVVLQVRPAGDLYDLGEISEFDEAVPAAMQRGGIQENWDISVIGANPERVIVACHPNHVDPKANTSLNRT